MMVSAMCESPLGSTRFRCSTGKNSKKRLFWPFAARISPYKYLILFAFDANSATLPNSGILAAYQGNKTAQQRNGSGIWMGL
jgi:hypothetical protein